MKLKKHLSIALMLMIVLSCFMQQYDVTAEAKALPRLSTTSKTIKVGKTVKIKLLNNKKKVKWSVTSSNIKIVKKTKKYAKVKGISVGSSNLAATVGSRTFICFFSVEEKKASNSSTGSNTGSSSGNVITNPESQDEDAFNAAEAEKKVTKEQVYVNGKVVTFFKNNYEMPVDIEGECYFYDSSGNPVETNYDYCSNLESGEEGCIIINAPSVSFATYEMRYKFSEPSYSSVMSESIIGKMKLSTNIVEDTYNSKIMATVTNGSDKEAECDLFFKFYDSLGNLVDVEKERVYSVPPESFKVEEMYMPHTYDTYDELEFSRYEGFISAAFFYD